MKKKLFFKNKFIEKEILSVYKFEFTNLKIEKGPFKMLKQATAAAASDHREKKEEQDDLPTRHSQQTSATTLGNDSQAASDDLSDLLPSHTPGLGVFSHQPTRTNGGETRVDITSNGPPREAKTGRITASAMLMKKQPGKLSHSHLLLEIIKRSAIAAHNFPFKPNAIFTVVNNNLSSSRFYCLSPVSYFFDSNVQRVLWSMVFGGISGLLYWATSCKAGSELIGGDPGCYTMGLGTTVTNIGLNYTFFMFFISVLKFSNAILQKYNLKYKRINWLKLAFTTTISVGPGFVFSALSTAGFFIDAIDLGSYMTMFLMGALTFCALLPSCFENNTAYELVNATTTRNMELTFKKVTAVAKEFNLILANGSKTNDRNALLTSGDLYKQIHKLLLLPTKFIKKEADDQAVNNFIEALKFHIKQAKEPKTPTCCAHLGTAAKWLTYISLNSLSTIGYFLYTKEVLESNSSPLLPDVFDNHSAWWTAGGLMLPFIGILSIFTMQNIEKAAKIITNWWKGEKNDASFSTAFWPYGSKVVLAVLLALGCLSGATSLQLAMKIEQYTHIPIFDFIYNNKFVYYTYLTITYTMTSIFNMLSVPGIANDVMQFFTTIVASIAKSLGGDWETWGNMIISGIRNEKFWQYFKETFLENFHHYQTYSLARYFNVQTDNPGELINRIKSEINQPGSDMSAFIRVITSEEEYTENANDQSQPTHGGTFQEELIRASAASNGEQRFKESKKVDSTDTLRGPDEYLTSVVTEVGFFGDRVTQANSLQPKLRVVQADFAGQEESGCCCFGRR